MSKNVNSDVESSMSTNMEPSRTKWAVLAVMRFFLALVVMLGHFALHGVGGKQSGLFSAFSGKAAVLGFFLISGYSIAHSLKRNRVGFYRRRFIRIYPLYFVSVIFSEALILHFRRHVTVGNMHFVGAGVFTSIGNIFFLQDILCITITFNMSLWSLGVEWFYYLMAPLVSRSRLIVFGLLTLSAAFYISPIGFQSHLLYGYTHFIYCWSWLLGFAMYNNKYNRRTAILVLLGSLVFAKGHEPAFHHIYGGYEVVIFTVPYLVAAVGIISSWDAVLPTCVEKIMLHLGDLSYPIYLFHIPLMILIGAKFHADNWFYLTIICIIVSEILFQTVDVYLKKKVLSPLILGSARRKTEMEQQADLTNSQRKE